MNKSTSKIWILAIRDGRSYEEVVESTTIDEIEVSRDVALEGLVKAYVCYFDGVEKTIRKLEGFGVEGLGISRFDPTSYLISKVANNDLVVLNEATLENLRKCFKTIIPWNRDIKQKARKKLEITRIPIHLWNDLTIEKI